MSAALAAKRLPWASNARAVGPKMSLRVAVGVVLPGANSLYRGERVIETSHVGHEEVAAGVEGQRGGSI